LVRFIEPMLLLRTEKLPEGPDIQFQIKFDGYRALAMKSGGQLRSRNDNDFNMRYPGIVKALAPMPDETIIDGEVVALDSSIGSSHRTLLRIIEPSSLCLSKACASSASS
jgi:bifunctional non-homologous end joining protein LigD